mmetsp:Transcript_19134/g.63248  ORF Transcript_19134/g.63248 Transcript_19134/m.63248 type:complete len:144 (+) Transcript_19134:815-1246(+)
MTAACGSTTTRWRTCAPLTVSQTARSRACLLKTFGCLASPAKHAGRHVERPVGRPHLGPPGAYDGGVGVVPCTEVNENGCLSYDNAKVVSALPEDNAYGNEGDAFVGVAVTYQEWVLLAAYAGDALQAADRRGHSVVRGRYER